MADKASVGTGRNSRVEEEAGEGGRGGGFALSDVFLDSRFSLRVGRAVQSQLGHSDRGHHSWATRTETGVGLTWWMRRADLVICLSVRYTVPIQFSQHYSQRRGRCWGTVRGVGNVTKNCSLAQFSGPYGVTKYGSG